MANKGKGRGFWNMLFSVGDPELRKVADVLKATLPKKLVESPAFDRVVGVIKGWAESKAEGLPPILGAVVEKLTDIGDFIRSGDEKGVKAAHDWMDKFYAEAAKRIEKSVDPEAELEKIKLEFELRQELLKVIEEARKAAEPAKPEKVSIDWSKIRNQYESFLLASARFTAKAVNRAEKTVKEVDRWTANTAAPAVHRFRTNQKWLKRSRRRRTRLEDQRQEQEEQQRQQREQQTRDRVAEFFDKFRRDLANRRGEQR